MFGDQDMNMAKSVSSGYALSLSYNYLTEEDLLAAINRVLSEPEYVLKISILIIISSSSNKH
jgi:UDP:flavonoid glycosyltransferase YjiC (YdhE family)